MYHNVSWWQFTPNEFYMFLWNGKLFWIKRTKTFAKYQLEHKFIFSQKTPPGSPLFHLLYTCCYFQQRAKFNFNIETSLSPQISNCCYLQQRAKFILTTEVLCSWACSIYACVNHFHINWAPWPVASHYQTNSQRDSNSPRDSRQTFPSGGSRAISFQTR